MLLRSEKSRANSDGIPEGDRASVLLSAMRRVPDMTWYVWDLGRQVVVEGEEALAAFHGWTVKAIGKRPGGWLSILHPDDLAVLENGSREVEQAAGREGATVELRVLRGDKKWGEVQLSWCALESSDGGGSLCLCVLRRLPSRTGSPREERSQESSHLLEVVGDAALMVTRDGTITDFNRIAARLLGVRQMELRGSSLFDRICGTEAESIRQWLAERSKDQATLTVDVVMRGKAGKRVLIEMVMKSLRSGLIYLGLREVSKLKARELAARRAAEHLEGLFENNTSGIVFVDRQMKITGVNQALCKSLKRSKKALIGSPLQAICAKGDCPDFASMMGASGQRPESGRVIELSLLTPTGESLIAQASPTFFRDASGEIDGGVIVLNDVTEQHKAAERLWERNQFYEALIRDASVMIVSIDLNGVVTAMNRAAERISGYSEAEICGQVTWKLFNLEPEDARLAEQNMMTLLKGGEETLSSPFRFRRRDGSFCHAETQMTLLRRPDGSPYGFVSTAVDVTERMRLEAEVVNVVESEQSRIGHDLHDGVGQMLTGAAALVDALSLSVPESCRAEAERAMDVIRQAVIETRRISHGLSPAAIKHRGLSGGLKLLADNIAASGRWVIGLEVDNSVEVTDTTVQTHLYRIAQEAVANAFKHSGSPELRIGLAREGSRAVLAVQDQGCGFDMSRAAVDGMGLRVMQHRANLVGATLMIESALGQGTIVRCFFDCQPPSPPRNRKKKAGPTV